MPPAADPRSPERAPRRLSREQRRAQILEVAEAAFAELGYQGASFEDIAVRAHVTRPLLYNYFRSKDVLYLECLRKARAELEEALSAAVGSEGSPFGQLRAASVAYFTFVRDRGRRWDMLFGGGAAVAGPVAGHAAELRFATADKLALLLARSVPHVPFEHAVAYAHAMSGAGEQLAKWWRRHPGVDLEEVVSRHLEVIWSGLEHIAEPPTSP